MESEKQEQAAARQQDFFKRLTRREGLDSIPKTLADLLGISLNSAYKRIRGEKLLNFYEIEQITTHFNLSATEVFEGTSNGQACFALPGYDLIDATAYMHALVERMGYLKAHSGAHLYVAGKDIFILHLCREPLLFAFKLYVWKKMTDDAAAPFRREMLTPELEVACQSLYAGYNQVPSTEVLSVSACASFLRQLHYMRYTGKLDDALFREMIELLRTTFAYLKVCVTKGRKSAGSGAELNFYINETILLNNTIHIADGDNSLTFLAYLISDYLQTDSREVNRHIRDWFRMLQEDALHISQTSFREREHFFNGIEHQISAIEEQADDPTAPFRSLI